VVNSANLWLLEALVHCAAEYPYGVNEMQKVGLTPIASRKVKVPRVKESALQFECRLSHQHTIGEDPATSTTVIFGTVLHIHVLDAVMNNGHISPELFQTVGRLGGISYTKLGEIIDIPIPRV
jgi:flavin reductase (DIM6/NTAB) family NADH-FMN oxidoreductase RutF